MKLLLIAAFVLVASAIPNTEWTRYKAKYNKVYTSEQEDNARYNQYLKTKKMIEEHNIRSEKGEATYTMGINHFSDWFEEEIQHILGFKHDNCSNSDGGEPFKLPVGVPIPKSMNWVKKGAVTRVKDQSRCGSCYAFSAAGALEGLMFIKNNTITDLSEQELMDCADGNNGCEGGLMTYSFKYVMKRHGIDTSASYPYKAADQKCKASDGVIAASCTGYKKIKDEDRLREAVGTVGPVSIGFAVDRAFLHYKGGIFDGNCGLLVNHAMLAVGYDKDKKIQEEYWLVKNSWGEDWGEDGYVRIVRNVNKCDIASYASYPVYSH